MQACGYRPRCGRNNTDRLFSRALAFGFHHRLRHFLYEQWNTVSALDDVLPNACREKLVADNAVDHGADFALCQSIDGNGGHVRPSDPRRLELWPEREDQQHAESWYLVH